MGDISIKQELSKDDRDIISISFNNKNMYLGSKYNEELNSKKFVDSINVEDGESIIIIIGLGCGTYIDYLLKKTSNNIILILEPNIEIYKNIKTINRYKSWSKNDRLHIENYKEEKDVLKIMDKIIDRSYLNKWTISIYTNYYKVFKDEIDNAQNEILQFFNIVLATRNTNVKFKEIVLRNYLDNFKQITLGLNANDFRDKFKNKTAIIIASGPSLHKNIEILKRYNENVIVIVAGRSLYEVQKHGINVDFITVIDPSEKMNNVLEKIKENKVPVVVPEQVNSTFLAEYKGEKIFVLNSFKETISNLLKTKYISLPMGGSVSHLSLTFALLLGVKNIIFIGQDLAMDGNKYHSILSNDDTLINSNQKFKGELYNVPGNIQDTVLTTRELMIFKDYFELIIKANKNKNYINATVGGAKIQGTITMDLESALEKYGQVKINKNIGLNSLKKSSCNIEREFINKLKKISILCEKGIKLNNRLENHYLCNIKTDVNKLVKELDNIDYKINMNNEISHLIGFVSYEKLEKVNFKFREKLDESEVDLGIRVAKKSREVYEIYLDSINILIESLSV